jgi:ribosome-associated protein
VKSKEKALLVAELAKAKLAEDIVILDMRKVSSITDFFVIASASSTKRCQTIAENIQAGLSKKQGHVSKIEGFKEGLWVLIDAYDVVAHIFYGDVRKFYNLEDLWGSAPRINPSTSSGLILSGASPQKLKTAIRRRRSIKLCYKKRKPPSKKTSKRN